MSHSASTTLLFISTLLAPMLSSTAEPTNWAATLDPIFTTALSQGEIPGAAVVVVEDGEVAFARGYGNAQDEIPFTANTRSYLGSVSKSFVGLAIIQLAQSGRIDLDADVRNYLPDFAVNNSNAPITIRQLLNHTSGLSRYVGNRNQTASEQHPEALANTVTELADWPLQSDPGAQFDYSNANYQILGRVIEVIANEPFERAMTQLVFAPIGMSSTQVSHPFDHEDAALGHRFWGPFLVGYDEPMGRALMPQGGVSTSAHDMGKYLIALSGGSQGVPNLWDPQLAVGHNLSHSDENYAAGWTVIGTAENPLLVHHGLNGGFVAGAALAPLEKRGIAVIVNASDGSVKGDLSYLIDAALQTLFPQLPLRRTDYTARWIQLVVLALIALILIVWVALFAKAYGAGKLRTPNWRKTLIPAVFLFGLAYLIGLWIPSQFGITLSGISVFYPDMGWLLTACAGLSFVWAIVRTLALYSIRNQTRQ